MKKFTGCGSQFAQLLDSIFLLLMLATWPPMATGTLFSKETGRYNLIHSPRPRRSLRTEGRFVGGAVKEPMVGTEVNVRR